MRLSMHILADWLKNYAPTISISEGKQVLRGVRLFSQDPMFQGTNQNVYIGRTKDFIPSSNQENVICVHGHDMLMLDTQDLEDVMNRVFDAFDFYNNWSDNLLEGIEMGISLQQLIDDSYCVFQEPIAIYDSSFVATAFSSQFPKGSISPDWDNIIDVGSHRIDSLFSFKDYFRQRRARRHAEKAHFENLTLKDGYWSNLYVGQQHCGLLFIIAKNHGITPGRLQLCETLSGITQKWLSHHQETAQMPSDLEMIKKLLDGTPDEYTKLLRFFELAGWQKNDLKAIFQISTPDYFANLGVPLANFLRRTFPNLFILDYRDSIVMLVNTTMYSFSYIVQTIQPILKQSHSFAATSYPFTDIRQVQIHYEQCILTTTFSPHKPGQVYHCKDYALEYILDLLKIHVNKNMVHPALGILHSQDKTSRSDLYLTLYIYLRNERNLVRTAEALGIHRNTLVYRLNKITDLTELDLNSPEVREYLILSYWLMDI